MRFFLLIVIILASGYSFSQTSNLKLHTHTFEEVEQLQKIQQKPVVIFIHTFWCKFCYAMKEKTFTNAEVINLLNEKFYFITFDANFKGAVRYMGRSFNSKRISRSYGIHELAEVLATTDKGISYPTTVILDAKNTIDEQITTYLSAKQLLSGLNAYLQRE